MYWWYPTTGVDRSAQLIHRLHQRHDIGCLLCPSARTQFRIVNHMRNVIVYDETSESDFFQRPHGCHDIDVAFAEETLLEGRHSALHVPEMDVEQLAARPEISHRFDHARPH